ncbi:HAD-superfamily hydrolase, subfamily IA, variant 1 [Phocaeicola salanitronis DSM 18170]|uniref:HAD-superfamily hydrolase, subfamily IA, variant 1 n=1 Tax=Phocaeicola salanitronis (strain DSM 18170 / JCM 13657 / CCUG 60908 / BL78) TaxID=667015 RepID=F0R259_PHOSB|nr:HAD family hydrolase [Phocaeicola salanitronis]ADY35391.1 HAD-superfamily hydrolase, subfamily IA, variant 1 [Phocaeicola salanitronis DSM 18170]
MKKLTDIQGVIFDYGGTIDTNSRHWAEVLWEKYRELQVPVDKPVFREAYVHGERTLARQPLVKPEDNFYDVLRIKTRVQMDWLVENGILPHEKAVAENYASRIADACYAYVLEVLKRTRPVVKTLSEHYKLVLVSNFYGNIQAVLKDFGLDGFFSRIVESSVVGVRKPDPAIYRLGVEAMGLPAGQVLVVGDSFSKDVVPAKKVGCKVAWLKGEGWGNEETDDSLPDVVITDLPDLLPYLIID